MCGKLFTTRHQVRAHVECVHLKIRKYKCETCGLACYKKHDLKRHLMRRGHVGSLQDQTVGQTAEIDTAVKLLDRLTWEK